jgi:DNA-3-methyladenine glycosylase I
LDKHTAVHRCGWANPANPRYLHYHDCEWGVPVTDDRMLFEMLVLEGAQAGLSWETILNKRDGYRRAFAGLDPAVVATFDDARAAALLADPGIVRNRLKVSSAIGNARAFLALASAEGSFARWLWGFVDGRPIHNAWSSYRNAPASTALSDTISKELSRRGFKFVGSTIVYAYLQAVGVINDHETACFRQAEVAALPPPVL